jgi:hypothetical protein
VLEELLARLQAETAHPPPPTRICRGPLLSRAQYLVDIEQWGYQDARLTPEGEMSSHAITRWTAAIEPEDRPQGTREGGG